MESIKPLHKSTLQKWPAFINRSHTILHILALLALFYYRTLNNHDISKVPFIIVLLSELFFSFLWLLKAPYGWRPISRTVFPERLLSDESVLPSIDVFVCTADPEKEPPLDVMNTVISFMALDYPPEKLSVYLSDDGGSDLTLFAMREAWSFAEKSWIPFCRKFRIKNRCPKAFFLGGGEDCDDGFLDFHEERDSIEKEYSKFMEILKVASEEERKKGRANSGRQHPPNIQIIGNKGGNSLSEMPMLVYVSREKNPNYPHNFKAGALNCLLRVSGCMSNAPYILVQDCDMYSNDPSSARQAMCFHLDQTMAPSLSFVQFPQNFHNINENDIYDGALRSLFVVKWPGLDGLRGPILSGTGFYMKRKSLYYSCEGNNEDKDLTMLKESFGVSNELLKSLSSVDNVALPDDILFKETKLLASSSYEKDTQWGKQIGFLYNSVCEDYFTGFILHCRGWKSVYCNPSRPAFLGTAPTKLSDTLVQGTRWNTGLLEVSLSRFCPMIYGFKRLPIMDCMTYAYLSLQPLFCIPVWCFAMAPQLCLLRGIPIYPKVSSPWFILFSFLFASPLVKDLFDILHTGGKIQTWWNEWRIWMIKSVTCYTYGSLDAFLKMAGLREANFLPTNKVADDEEVTRYEMGLFDFQASMIFLAPLVSLTLLNMASFLFGIVQVILGGFLWEDMFGQIFISFFILAVNYPIIEGMVFRKDRGCITLHATLVSTALVFALVSSCYVFAFPL